MATPRTGLPVGHPTDYKPEYCPMLIDHMKRGFSFTSFGAVVMVCAATLYNWLEAFPEFLEAKNLGSVLSLKHYEEMGQALATGQLKVLVEEEPITNPDGTFKMGPDGKVVMRKRYEKANGNVAAFILMAKNMHRMSFRDAPMVPTNNQGEVDNMTAQEIEKAIRQATERIALRNQNDRPTIDVSPISNESGT